MAYQLHFIARSEKEWAALDSSVQAQFKKKLAKVLENPHIPSAALRGMPNCYKIKLKKVGYRLIYQVKDEVVTVTVISVGRREKNQAYSAAAQRLKT